MRRVLVSLALAAVCSLPGLGCLDAEPVEATRDSCLKAIAREFTAYMNVNDCRRILGAEYCRALLIGMDVRAGRGDSSEKIQRVFYAHCT